MSEVSKKNRMTIHYVWFEDYGPYYNQGINLSSKYKFSYSPENNKVYYTENSDAYLENFWGENIDCTAIVGMNGTGKTMLLRFLLSLRNEIVKKCAVEENPKSEIDRNQAAW